MAAVMVREVASVPYVSKSFISRHFRWQRQAPSTRGDFFELVLQLERKKELTLDTGGTFGDATSTQAEGDDHGFTRTQSKHEIEETPKINWTYHVS